ncbi:MAG: hypothetical protein HFE80_01315 [Clostridiaceae bacterium]|nr:hypothetical protein [Clostridiaceae bacterium]
MSMPSFPPNGANMTREEALTMIIASIAMEELALSHILNAEGEKLQYILGTLPGARPCACPQDVLAVNKSVAALVEAVTQNQILLKNKLDQVLEFCPPPPPPPPACRPEPCPSPCPPPCRPEPPCPPPCPAPRPYLAPPCEKSLIQLTSQREKTLWNPDCRLPWRQRSRRGKDVRWDERIPAQIQLNPKKTYAIQYTLNVCASSTAEGRGAILLKQSLSGAFTDALPLYFAMEHLRAPQTLHAVSVLYPRMNGGREVGISLALDAKTPLYVERAVIDIVEI